MFAVPLLPQCWVNTLSASPRAALVAVQKLPAPTLNLTLVYRTSFLAWFPHKTASPRAVHLTGAFRRGGKRLHKGWGLRGLVHRGALPLTRGLSMVEMPLPTKRSHRLLGTAHDSSTAPCGRRGRSEAHSTSFPIPCLAQRPASPHGHPAPHSLVVPLTLPGGCGRWSLGRLGRRRRVGVVLAGSPIEEPNRPDVAAADPTLP